MTDDELDRLDALAQAATPGPWQVRKHPGEFDMVRQAEWTTCGDPGHWDCAVTQTVHDVSVSHSHLSSDRAMRDAAFIAASRTAIPALVAEVRRLRALVGEDRRASVD